MWARVAELRIDIQSKHKVCVMILCIKVLDIINAQIRIVQNFVDRPSASTSSASSWGVFVLLYKAVIRAKFYANKAIRSYGFINKGTQRDTLYYFNVRNIFQGK